MESLSLNDPPQDAPVFPGAAPPHGPPQLPPQMFTTAAQLLDLTDKKLLLVLRDGRKLLGVLRTWDQFANLVLTETKERYYASVSHTSASASASACTATGTTTSSSAPSSDPNADINPSKALRNLFCDIPRGTYLVRGENVLLIGEVDLDTDDDPPRGYEEGDVEEVFAIQKGMETERRRGDKRRARRVGELWGGEVEGVGEVLF